MDEYCPGPLPGHVYCRCKEVDKERFRAMNTDGPYYESWEEMPCVSRKKALENRWS
jgi:hypothetical protein